ncbi:MAG: hypothetical protein QHG99_05320 [Methanomicrobiales archaeon]|nr:hypothetical protein [Methanomicrobiales archaeon]
MLERVRSEVELLGRHLRVLSAVMEHQPIGIMRLAELLDLPYHRIRYSLRVLEQMGYIRASQEGAIALERAYELNRELDDELDEILAMVSSMKKKKSHNV